MEEAGRIRRALGDAIWLWIACGMHTDQSNVEADWWLVADGGEISDERIGVYLDVSAPRAKKWRVRLERFGMLRTEMLRPSQRRSWMRNPAKLEEPTTLAKAPLQLSRMVH